MKKVLRIIGIILIILQIIAFANNVGYIGECLTSGSFGMLELFGFCLLGLIGVLFVFIAREK